MRIIIIHKFQIFDAYQNDDIYCTKLELIIFLNSVKYEFFNNTLILNHDIGLHNLKPISSQYYLKEISKVNLTIPNLYFYWGFKFSYYDIINLNLIRELMRNLYIDNVGCDYYVSIADRLSLKGFNLSIVLTAESTLYRPKSLDALIIKNNPLVIKFEDICLIERFEKIFDPDYSIFNIDYFSDISYFEKLFLMTIDRNSFDPLSQIDRLRIFHKYIAHAYKLLRKKKIDTILFFGTPHGPWSIAILAVAKYLKIDIRYTDWVVLSADLTTIENDIYIRKEYNNEELKLGSISNPKEKEVINKIFENNLYSKTIGAEPRHINRSLKIFLRTIKLFFFQPFSRYLATEFFLNHSSRLSIFYAHKYLLHLFDLIKALNFYDKNVTRDDIEENSLVIFLHWQPEASTMPMGYVFSDQILLLEMILSATPQDLKIYIKEHPYIYENPAQDRHERSKKFYKQLLRDPRVKFLSRRMNSNEIITKAKYITSVCGSVSWEALRIGKPSIVFGRAWFSSCKSCYSVDSVSSLKEAIKKIDATTYEEVQSNLETFVKKLKGRLIYGAASRDALSCVNNNFRYNDAINNIANGIANSFGEINNDHYIK